MMFKNTQVYTSDKKSAGKIVKVNAKYFVSYKRGLVTDEQYRIPLDAISTMEPTIKEKDDGDNNIITVRLALSENELKHGYEFVKGKPNSEFVSGKATSEPKIPAKKQVIYYQALDSLEEEECADATDSIRLPNHDQDLLHYAVNEYICDRCMEKFNNVDQMQKHKAEKHKGPIE